MRQPKATDARPYHHGDLRRALVTAARRLLEAEGPAALSLRAVAREAGVSPAAPYHHFKDKGELLGAVASEGWALLSRSVISVSKKTPRDHMGPPLDSIHFARRPPAHHRSTHVP